MIRYCCRRFHVFIFIHLYCGGFHFANRILLLRCAMTFDKCGGFLLSNAFCDHCYCIGVFCKNGRLLYLFQEFSFGLQSLIFVFSKSSTDFWGHLRLDSDSFHFITSLSDRNWRLLLACSSLFYCGRMLFNGEFGMYFFPASRIRSCAALR